MKERKDTRRSNKVVVWIDGREKKLVRFIKLTYIYI